MVQYNLSLYCVAYIVTAMGDAKQHPGMTRNIDLYIDTLIIS